MITAVALYQFAGEIYRNPNYQHETAYRTVINRAYYAAFLAAKDYTQINNSSGSVHNEVIGYFVGKNRGVYKNFKDLKELRSLADYKITEKVYKREAGEALRLTQYILTTLNYLP
jgi:uncharacterized protein (UPF0332 family)